MKSFFEKKTGSGFDPAKMKANFRMATTRLAMQKNKALNSVKMQRRRIAELLAIGKYDSARIQVEQCIRDDVSIEGFEVLSLFLDLLSNRISLIAESKPVRTSEGKKDPTSACPPELKEYVSSVLWASSRLGDTVPELVTIRKGFESKFGKEFVAMAQTNSEYSVNQKMMDRLGMYAPHNDKCIAYLEGIAKEFSITTFDEEKLKDPNGLVASATVVAGGAPGGAGSELAKQVPGSIRTPSGLYIPPMGEPKDHLDHRLQRLIRM